MDYLITVKDAAEVIQLKDKEKGFIEGKGCIKFHIDELATGTGVEYTAWHIFKIQIKEERIRVTITFNNIKGYYPGEYLPMLNTYTPTIN